MPQIIFRKTAASPWIKQSDRLTKTFSSGLCLIQQTYIAPKALATYDAFQEGDAITESQPCIDGAYIFPAPDYQDTGNGFMRCTVTAYGRWKTDSEVSRRKRKITLGVYGSVANMPGFFFTVEGEEPLPVTINFGQVFSNDPLNKAEVLTDDLVLKFVLPSTQTDLPLTPPNSLIKIYKITGEQFPSEFDILILQTLFGGKLKWQYSQQVNGEFQSTSGFITLNSNDYKSVGYDSLVAIQNGISFILTSCESVEYGRFHEYTATFEAAGKSFTKNEFILSKNIEDLPQA
jgi:hypothetical protein